MQGSEGSTVCPLLDKKFTGLLKKDNIPTFYHDEFSLGDGIGKGRFSIVREIVDLPFDRLSNSTDETEYERQSRDAIRARQNRKRRLFFSHMNRIATSCYPAAARKGRQNEACFVVKHLSEEGKRASSSDEDEEHWHTIAMSHFASEAVILGSLDHPHVVKLWGLSTPRNNVAAFGDYGQYYLVLERLHGTLDEQIRLWLREREEYTKKSLWPNTVRRKNAQMNRKRLHAATQLCDALKYIHQLNVVHRDLKPSNVGFDFQGNIKLFDFGFARDLHCETKTADGRYKLTGKTGSLRYMAPEVYEELPYDTSADVYSLSIILWEVMSLRRAFDSYNKSNRSFVRDVFFMGLRPELSHLGDSASLKYLKEALGRGWSTNPRERLTCAELMDVVEKELLLIGS